MGKSDFVTCGSLWSGLIPNFPWINSSFPSLFQSINPRFRCNLGFGALSPKLFHKSSPKNPTAITRGSSKLNPNPPKFIPLDPLRFTLAGATNHWDIPRMSKGLGYRWQHLQLSGAGGAGRGRCELFNSGAMTSINNGRCFPTCGKRPGKQLDPNQSTGSRP